MRTFVLAAIFALSASTSLAQTGTAPEPAAPAAAPAAQQAGGPANLCQELLAFMKAPPPEAAVPAKQAAPAKQAETSGSGGTAPVKPETGTGSAQKESKAAPLPPSDATSMPRDSVVAVAKAEELAATNDIAECQKIARAMRVAGVAMPPPLLALIALDLQYQQKSSAPTQPSGAADPAATGQDPAPQTQTPQ